MKHGLETRPSGRHSDSDAEKDGVNPYSTGDTIECGGRSELTTDININACSIFIRDSQ